MELHHIHPKAQKLERSVDSYLFAIPEETRSLSQIDYHHLRAALLYTLLQREKILTVNNVLSTVAERGGVTIKSLDHDEGGTHHHLHALRGLAAYIYRQYGFSYPETQKQLGRADHRTIIEHEQMIKEALLHYNTLTSHALRTSVPDIDYLSFAEQHKEHLLEVLIQGELTIRRPDILPNNILNYLAKATGTSFMKLMGSNKTPRMANVRKVGYFLLKEHFRLSFPTVGDIMGRNHSSAMGGYNQVKDCYAAHQQEIAQHLQNRLIFPHQSTHHK